MIRHREHDGSGYIYYLTAEEDKIVQEFLAFVADKSVPKLKELAQTLTDSRGKWDPNHDQGAKCCRQGCGHPYERHFDTYADMEPVGCKYCGCDRFVEPHEPAEPVPDF